MEHYVTGKRGLYYYAKCKLCGLRLEAYTYRELTEKMLKHYLDHVFEKELKMAGA